MFNEMNSEFMSTINENIKMNTQTIDGKEVPVYKNLKDYVGQRLNVVGFYIRDTKYGKQVTVQCDNGVWVNLPKYMTTDFEEMTVEQKKAVLDGKLCLTDIKTKTNKTYGTEMVVCKYSDR